MSLIEAESIPLSAENTGIKVGEMYYKIGLGKVSGKKKDKCC